MSDANWYDEGAWNIRCSMCGRKRKSGEVVRNWQGQYRCPEHNEPRHPQDFVKAGPPPSVPAFVQAPEPDEIVICTPNGTTSIAGFAVAGCWRAGYRSPFFDPLVTE